MRAGKLNSPAGKGRVARLQTAVAVLAVFVVTMAAYFPALRGGLLWDDAAHVTAARLQGWTGLWSIWFKLGTTQQYYPVLHSAFWLEHRAWGDSVLGYHLANVVLHAAAACLFARVLARIRLASPGWPWPEWLAAAVFALHPVCVESVAWISEQKNTLSTVFYLLAALAYLRFDREGGLGWYFLGLLLFALALLSKSVTATLPAALVLVSFLRRGQFSFRRDAAPLLPWFAVGIASGLFTAWVERNLIGAFGRAFGLSLVERCFLAGRAVWFYLGKLVWPANLIFVYPRWHVAVGWAWSLGCVALAALLAILWALRKWRRGPLVAFLFFVGSLFPALGFFNVYPFIFSYVADHFQYLACLGIIALAAAGGAELARGIDLGIVGAGRVLAQIAFAAVAGLVLIALFALTWRQAGHYRDAGALYEDTLARNPGCWMADNNLGVYLMERGSLEEAIAHLRHAVLLKPDYSDAHNNLGNALSRVPGHSDEAVSEFETAIALEPGMAQAHANLGLALANTPGRRQEGIEQLETALRANAGNPDYAQAHADLAVALSAEPGRMSDSFAEFEAALHLRPESAEVCDNFGIALAHAGRLPAAAEQFRRAIRIRPGNAEFHNNLGGVLSLTHRDPEAIAEYRQAVALSPALAGAHFNLGRALGKAGDGREAIAEHLEAERLAPGSAEIRSSLGSLYFKLGKIREAVAEYRSAVSLEPSSAPYHYNLGVALSAAGMVDQAIGQFRAALRLQPGFRNAHHNLGIALEKTGREEEAAAEFSAAGRQP